MARGRLVSVMALSLLAQAFCGPVVRPRRGYRDNELDSDEFARGDLMSTNTSADESFVNPAVSLPPPSNTYEDKRKEFQAAQPFDDDDDDFPEMQTSSTGGGGSNIISLLNLVNGLFPASGNPNFQRILRSMLREYLRRYPQPLLLPQNKLLRRQDFFDNEIEIYETFHLEPPPFQRQESDDDGSEIESNGSGTKEDSEESNKNNGTEESKEKSDESNSSKESKEKSDESNSSESSKEKSSENHSSEESKEKSDENTGAEESVEGDDENTGAEESLGDDDNTGDASQQDEDSKPASDNNGGDSDNDGDRDNDNDSDYDDDEPPEGDGQGGGILGILAGLSGDNGESDLGSLLATISGIVVSLSGDGIDLNSLIASGIGLFVGLLSEGEENPGSILASYLLTSLETITGGGSKNNGAFFGKFLSKLISGTSAGEAPEGASDEDGEPAEGMKDSAGFIASLLMGFSGDMSKGSFAGSSKSR